MEQLLLTVAQPAEVHQISPSYLYELKSRNRIRYVKIGANLRFRPEDLRSYVNELADASKQKRQQQEFEP